MVFYITYYHCFCYTLHHTRRVKAASLWISIACCVTLVSDPHVIGSRSIRKVVLDKHVVKVVAGRIDIQQRARGVSLKMNVKYLFICSENTALYSDSLCSHLDLFCFSSNCMPALRSTVACADSLCQIFNSLCPGTQVALVHLQNFCCQVSTLLLDFSCDNPVKIHHQ